MAIVVVIGAGTTVDLAGATDACWTSANWGMNPGRQDAFCLGEVSPSTEYVLYKPTQTLSLTGYAPTRGSYNIPPNTDDCADAGVLAASVSTQPCGDGANEIDDVDGEWWVQSYSYSKETKDQPAQETWSLIKYKGEGFDDFLTNAGVDPDRIAEPTYVMRGITMGESTEDIGSATQTGITFDTVFAAAQQGSVSAGSFGTARTTYHGSVDAVGGGTSSAGFKGAGSASIPYTPLYI